MIIQTGIVHGLPREDPLGIGGGCHKRGKKCSRRTTPLNRPVVFAVEKIPPTCQGEDPAGGIVDSQ